MENLNVTLYVGSMKSDEIINEKLKDPRFAPKPGNSSKNVTLHSVPLH
jgi:hypothetical protein